MRIDLHLHSPLSKLNGDSIKFNSYFDSLRTLKSFNIKMASFTDHNIFKSSEYFESREIANKFGIKLLPGVELNVIRLNGVIGHVIVIFDDELNNSQYEKIEELVNNIAGRSGIRIQNLNNVLSDFKTIIVPHVGKGDFCTYEDLKYVDFDAIEVPNKNHHNYKKFKKIVNNEKVDISIVAWSDTHRWSHYPEIGSVYTWIPNISGFSSLKEEFKNNNNYTKEY